MPIVRVPSPLRRLTDGRAEVAVPGPDVRSVIANLDAVHPGIAERLLDAEGGLHGFVHVFVRDEDVRSGAGLDTLVGADDTVSVVPAVAGGV
ncbi:MAG TPA: MoaD/ThiS family protein [Egicoccus sp.]|nr:MoaD/ThiS family protein [Egicoccus sp.]HSK24718.1 MoaD/ThiS family protein [Egicoccus sp.]